MSSIVKNSLVKKVQLSRIHLSKSSVIQKFIFQKVQLPKVQLSPCHLSTLIYSSDTSIISFRSDVLGSYSSTPSNESIKYIDEDVSMTADVVETYAEIHPVPNSTKSPKPILRKKSSFDRHQQTLDSRDKVVIVPSLKLEKESPLGFPHNSHLDEDDDVFSEPKR